MVLSDDEEDDYVPYTDRDLRAEPAPYPEGTKLFLERLDIFAHAMHDTGIEVRIGEELHSKLEELQGNLGFSAKQVEKGSIDVEIRFPAPVPYKVGSLELELEGEPISALAVWVSADSEDWVELGKLSELDKTTLVALPMEPQLAQSIYPEVVSLDGHGGDISALWLQPMGLDEGPEPEEK